MAGDYPRLICCGLQRLRASLIVNHSVCYLYKVTQVLEFSPKFLFCHTYLVGLANELLSQNAPSFPYWPMRGGSL